MYCIYLKIMKIYWFYWIYYKYIKMQLFFIFFLDLNILMCLLYVYLYYIHIWLDFWVKKWPEMFCRFNYGCFQIGNTENIYWKCELNDLENWLRLVFMFSACGSEFSHRFKWGIFRSNATILRLKCQIEWWSSGIKSVWLLLTHVCCMVSGK